MQEHELIKQIKISVDILSHSGPLKTSREPRKACTKASMLKCLLKTILNRK